MAIKIAAVIVAVILLLGGGYLFLHKNAVAPSNTTNPKSTPTTMNQGTLSSLFNLNKSQKCDITYSDNSGSGTLYLANKNVRGDFNTTIDNKTTVSHVIFDGTYMYEWGDSLSTGIKMKFNPSAASPSPTTSSSPTNSSGNTTNLNQKVDYKCSSWTVDNSMFIPPTSVKFTDFSTLMAPEGSPTSQGVNSAQCAACNSLTGNAKAQCLTTLHCQ